MQDESLLGRSLWTVVLTVVVAIVVLSFARHPLIGGEGEASGFGPPLTLWIAGDGAGTQAEAVAGQAASCLEVGGRSATVGVLPGGSSTAVADFLNRVRGTPNELLLVTSTTLADIARDRRDTLLPEEPRELARRADRLLSDAAPIAVLGSDAMTLAVRSGSPIHSTAQLLALMRRSPSRPLFDVAADTWLRGNLAALVQSAGLHGEMPYGVFDSSRAALASLTAGEAEVVVAPHSAIGRDLRSGRLRELPWPARVGGAPRAWMAILAPGGLRAGEVAALRARARNLCTGAVWRRLLRGDGLTPVASSSIHLRSFVRAGVREATRLQVMAARIMRDY